MALKKYRFAVGICGPTILYTNIIRAKNETIAAMNYLSEIGEAPTEERIADLLRNVSEIIPRKDPDKLLDYMGKEIVLGDEVMFIRNKSGEAPKMMRGRVDKVSGKSVVITSENGESNRIILSVDDDDRLSRVIVMAARPKRTGSGPFDASGYPLREGDPLVYMNAIAYNRCDGFQMGALKKLTEKSVEVNGTKRSFERVLVINW